MKVRLRIARPKMPSGGYKEGVCDIDQNILFGVRVCHTALASLHEVMLKEHSASLMQFYVLQSLFESEGRVVTQASLSRPILYDQGAMSGIIHDMVKRRLIRRRKDIRDRRVSVIEMAPFGAELYPSLREAAIRALNIATNGLLPADLRHLIAIIKLITKNAATALELQRPVVGEG